MKKSLLALAVMTAAGSAHAGFEIYNQDDVVTVSMGGDIEVVYVKDTAKNSDFAQDIQDADLDFDVRYAVSESVQVGAFWQFTDVGTSEGDAYVAAYSDTLGSLKIGRLCTVLDDAGIGSDYQFGITTFFEDSEAYCADEVARYDFDNGDFYTSVAIAQDYNGDIGIKDSSTYYDGRIGYRVADFDFTALYGEGTMIAQKSTFDSTTGKTTTAEDPTTEHDETLFSVQAAYNGVENLGLAVAYYDMTKSAEGIKDISTDTIALAATYTIEKTVLAAGYATSSSSLDAVKDEDTWYLNAGYNVAPNTTLYAEVGGTDKDNTDTGYAVGVKAFF